LPAFHEETTVTRLFDRHDDGGPTVATSKVRSNTRLAVTTVVAVVGLASGCWFQAGFGPRRSAHNPHERGLTSANVATLTEAWSVPLGAGPVLDPVVSKDGVHAVVGDNLHTRNLSDGSNRWSVQVLPPPAPGRRQIVASPSLRNDQVLVPAHGIPLDSPQPGNGIRRYDTATGAQGPLLTGTARGSLTVHGDVVASMIREELNLIDHISTLSVGDLAVPSRGWTTILEFGGSDIAPVTTPALGHDTVLIGRGTAVYAYTRARPAVCNEPFPGLFFCDPIWFRTLGGTSTVPVLSDDEETVFVGDSAGGSWALDADDGSVAWQADLGGGGAMPQVLAAPTVGDGRRRSATVGDGRRRSATVRST
jgi:outer membrane protein assembly factor BamB